MRPKPFESAGLFIGSELEGRYRIEAKLGAGGVGAVYRATHLKLGRAVAIKVLQEQYGASKELRKRFEREAHALAGLSHPHIVTVTDYGIFRGMPFLVMELLEGQTLGQLLRAGPLPPSHAIDIARQLLRALAFVHEGGLVHRDLKPGNIFLQEVPGSQAHVKLLDFGLAKFIAPEAGQHTLTRAGQVFGTPSYMAPEQVSGEPTDPSTDVYAVGILLYEMLSGDTPFQGDASQVMRKHLVEDLPELTRHCPDREASPELRALLVRATGKLKRERFVDAIELSAALNALSPPFVRTPGAPHSSAPAQAGRSPAAMGPRSLRQTARHAAPPLIAIATLFALLLFLRKESEDPRAPERIASSPSQPAPPVAASVEPPVRAVVPPSARVPVPATTGPEVSAPAQAPSPPPRASQAQAIAAPAAPITAEALWARAPKLLTASRDAVDRGIPLSRQTMSYIHKYNADNRGDPRGHLVLAQSHLSRGWRRDAANEYAIAFELNPDARAHPAMLPDLLQLVAAGSRTAEELVRSAYGPTAVDAIDRALEREAVDRVAAERLRKLRERLGT